MKNYILVLFCFSFLIPRVQSQNKDADIYGFVISFIEIVEKAYNCSNIDRIFVELFKKANDFEICIEHLKKS